MNKNINILIVEDDGDINNLLYKILTRQGYKVTSAYSGSEASMCLEKCDFQLVLLDLMLPAMTGEKLIAHIRSSSKMPIIVVSAKPGQDVKIDVLKLGADDFVSKPFDVNEVLARVEAQLRRYMLFSAKDEKQDIIKYKNLILNCEAMEALVKGQKVSLTAREFSILQILISYPNKVFTKGNLFEHAWREEYLGDDNTINVHISNIRSKISKIDPEKEYIHTVWGIGFKASEVK